MKNAEHWIQPTNFTGNWPNWNGFTFLDWDKKNNVFHPGDDYNFGYGNQDFGQDVNCTFQGVVVHTSKRTTGYGNLIIVKHSLGYNLKRFIKETYGIETNELYSLYAHLKDIFVNIGDKVNTGQRIGTVGHSGVTWAHLHFEIYAPIEELASEGWRFYPVGWGKNQIKRFWLPAYQFIESTKNIDSYVNYLGKSKEYWITVEKDREELLTQLTQKDIDWAKKLESVELENEQSLVESARKINVYKKTEVLGKKEHKNLIKKIDDLKIDLKTVKLENVKLLQANAKDISFASAVKIVFYTIQRKFSRGGDIQ